MALLPSPPFHICEYNRFVLYGDVKENICKADFCLLSLKFVSANRRVWFLVLFSRSKRFFISLAFFLLSFEFAFPSFFILIIFRLFHHLFIFKYILQLSCLSLLFKAVAKILFKTRLVLIVCLKLAASSKKTKS